MVGAAPSGERLLLLCRLAERRVAIPVAAVDQVLPMAALTPLAGAPESVAGVLAVRGVVLPVVDPRPRFGLSTPVPHPDQFLVLLAACHRYVLWLDGVEGVETVSGHALQPLSAAADLTLTPAVARLHRGVVPIISPAAFAPRRFTPLEVA